MSNRVLIKQFKNKAKEPVAGLTPEHAIYDKNGVRLDAKLNSWDLSNIRNAQTEGVRAIIEATKQYDHQTIINNGTINNAADEEDITVRDNVLSLKDRTYIEDVGEMGYIILRKNKSFAEQVTKANTIYEIRYEFDLNGNEIQIPANCILKFEGGSLDNGVIIGNKTKIDAPSYKIFGDNLALFKYGYIRIQSGYIDDAMVALDYVVENGVLNINKVLPNTQLFSKYNYTEKLVTDGYERASNWNNNGVISPIGDSLDVRTDLVVSPKVKAMFSNNTATIRFNSAASVSLNGHQFLDLNSENGILTIPQTTRFLFYDGAGNLLSPGNRHADNDIYGCYMSKLIPLVSQSTFVGSAKLSWFIGDSYVDHVANIKNAPNVTEQFQKAMLSSFDIDVDIEGYIRIEDSIYLETSKVINFRGYYGCGNGVTQYNAYANTRANRNYNPKSVIYTLSANKPLLYIRNSSIKILGGYFTAQYADAHTTAICVFDTDFPISGIILENTVFRGKQALDTSLESVYGVYFMPRGMDGKVGYCSNSNLTISTYNCQYGVSFNGFIANINLNILVDGFYKTLIGKVSMTSINMIAQANQCMPKSLADGLVCDVTFSGGSMDGFFSDLGNSNQTSEIIRPYGKGFARGIVQLIGKSTYINFMQWEKPDPIYDNYTTYTASIPVQNSIWRNATISVSRFIKNNINTKSSTGHVYKITDEFTKNANPTTDTVIRSMGIYYFWTLFDVNSPSNDLPVIEDDEYLELVFYPKSTDSFLRETIVSQYFTVYRDSFRNIQIILNNDIKYSIVADISRTPIDIHFNTAIPTKITSIIVRFWNKIGSSLPHIFIWDNKNNINNNLGINHSYIVSEEGEFSKYINNKKIGAAAIAQLNVNADSISQVLDTLKTVNSHPVLISQYQKGVIWQYKDVNKKLWNLDGTEATLLHVGSSADRPIVNINGTSLTKGTTYRDTTLCKDIIWNGNKWLEEDGATAGVSRSGTFSNKPVAADIYTGFKYMITENNPERYLPIYYGGNNKWYDAAGNEITE